MADLKEERKYERLRKLAQELHIPLPEAFLTLEVFDKDGKLIQKHHQRSHSWVRNAYNCLFSDLAGVVCNDDAFGAGKLNVKKTDESIIKAPYQFATGGAYNVDGTVNGYRAPAGDDEKGILVGGGATAESFEDYNLDSQIAEGAGAGQLSHAASEAHNVTYTAGPKVLQNELVRYFNNNSGGGIDVNEVALVTEGICDAFHIDVFVLVSRDVLGSTVNVPDTGQLKVTYTIQLTYPS
ncbi:hypothetical protein ES705_25215 [subsurface metagenome]